MSTVHKLITMMKDNNYWDPILKNPKEKYVEMLWGSEIFKIGNVKQLPEIKGEPVLNLPYPSCVFELSYPGEMFKYCWLLCVQEEKNASIRVIVFMSDGCVATATGYVKLHKHEYGKEGKISVRVNTKVVDNDNEVLYGQVTSKRLTEILMCMECNNIYIEKNAPDEKLQKKRKKHNKVPLFEYKTLCIQSTKERVIEKSVAEESDNRRAGPRVHLRRGHIRHLPSGTKTWVQSCVVGELSNGMVVKDYLL